jgi:hypothetical protein
MPLQPASEEEKLDLYRLEKEFETRNWSGDIEEGSTIKGERFTILSKNPTCLKWEKVGGTWMCTGGWI